MRQIRAYMAKRDAEDLERIGLLSINLVCIWTVVLCISAMVWIHKGESNPPFFVSYMKAIQIVMKGDERSEEYAYLSRRSFQRAIDDGYLDSIETFDAITPQSEDFQDHVDKYVWSKRLMTLDINSKNSKEDHSPT